MALRIIQGVPRSGKSFYAVRHLAKHYFKKDKETGIYDLCRECVIITNVDGFKPDHVDLKKEIKEAGRLAREALLDSGLSDRDRKYALDKLDPVAEFFSYDYQEKYKEGKPPLVYVIDEAQRLFRKGMDRALKERDAFGYFEYHGHWGQEVYLITQNQNKLPPDLVHLTEYIISAYPRSRTIGIGMKYDWVSGRDVIKTETLFPDQGVFALYRSMETAESEKVTNPMLPKIGMALLASFAVCYAGYRYFSGKYHSSPLPPDPPPVAETSSSSSSGFGLGDSYVPIGSRRAVKPEPRYVVFVPLSSVTNITSRDMRSLYVWRGRLIPPEFFPHKTVYRSGQRYAVLDYELFDFMFGDSEDRPADFIVQVKDPEPGDGSGAADRSDRRSDLSGGGAQGEAQRTERGNINYLVGS